MSLRLLRPADPAWEELFACLPSQCQDAFYSAEFARVCQATLNRDDEVLCAALSIGADVILYPFAKRPVGRVTGRSGLDGLYDLTGLYGRGGVVASEGARAHLPEFHRAVAEYCRGAAAICGFDRYHPVMGNDAWAAADTRIMETGGFVVLDLRPDRSALEASFKQSVRKDFKKGERNGVVCWAETGNEHLPEFLDIYRQTMERNSASAFYHFGEEYFRLLGREMVGQFHYFFASAGGSIVSCELVLHHGKYGHSFLGGTKREALSLCANPLLKREIIQHLKARGAEYFLLGGGTRPDDGIFKYKKAYAPEGVLPSRVGGTVWDRRTYDDLRVELSTAGIPIREGRFQFYETD